MKAIFKFILGVLLVSITNINALSASLNVYVEQTTSAWCGQATGELKANVSGGQPPYIYLWNIGSPSQTISGLSAGTYSVTVTDNLGATVVEYGTVDDIPQPPFYGLNVVMSTAGQNNGSAEVAMYSTLMGSATYIPAGQVIFNLWNQATSQIVETYTETCNSPGCYTIYHTFDSLPPGHYMSEGIFSGFGSCASYSEFYLKEMPSITPSLSSLPACNSTATGKVVGHLNPLPNFDSYTFSSAISGVFNTPPVFMAYKLIFYDGGTPIKRYNTRDSIFTIDGFAPGNYNYTIYAGDTFEFNQNPYLHDSVLLVTGNITVGNDPNCSYVHGRVFADQNKNCNYDGTDLPLKNVLVEFNPGGYSITSDIDGNYLIPLPIGNYTLTQHTPYIYKQLCPDSATFLLNNTTVGASILLNIADSIAVEPDLNVGIISGTARPGFDVDYVLVCSNLTPHNVPSQTLKFTVDTSLTLVSVSSAPITVNGNVYEFNTSTISAFGKYEVHFTFNVPATTVLGSQLISFLDVTTAPNELSTSNNFDTLVQIVTGSFDPNDISVSPPGYTSQGYITNEQVLNYTINFQNTGTDTAFNVTVLDTLPLALNKYTLQVLGASHPYSYEFKAGNVVAFHFNNLLLPDSNSNESASHGYIKYKISQNIGNSAGTLIKNSAAIYFDYNLPVITNQVINTIFDCNQMYTLTLSNLTLCESESINGIVQTIFPMEVNWFLDAVQVANEDTITINSFSTGVHSLETVISNDFCTVNTTNTFLVNANPAQPTITQQSGILSSSTAFSYQWYLSGQPILGAINSNHTPTVNGFYSVLVIDSNGCSALSDSLNVTSVGLSAVSLGQISISPNPVNDNLLILNNSDFVITSVMITDLSGKELFNYRDLKSNSEISLNLIQLSSGLYILKLQGENTLRLFKFIRQ